MMTSALTDQQQNFLCQVINRYSDGDHPEASPEVLDFFLGSFARSSLERMLEDPIATEYGRKLAQEIVFALDEDEAKTLEVIRAQYDEDDAALDDLEWDEDLEDHPEFEDARW